MEHLSCFVGGMLVLGMDGGAHSQPPLAAAAAAAAAALRSAAALAASVPDADALLLLATFGLATQALRTRAV